MAIKKLISLLLAVLLVATVAVTAYAEEETEPTVAVKGGQSADVTVNITDENGNPMNPSPVYRVVISWKDLEFQVTATEAGWFALGRCYILTDGALPEGQMGFVTVTNHSNVPVTVTAAFAGAGEDTPLVSQTTGGIEARMELTTGTMTDGTVIIDSAEGCGDSPPYAQFTVTPHGQPQYVPDLSYTVDKITVTVEK